MTATKCAYLVQEGGFIHLGIDLALDLVEPIEALVAALRAAPLVRAGDEPVAYVIHLRVLLEQREDVEVGHHRRGLVSVAHDQATGNVRSDQACLA